MMANRILNDDDLLLFDVVALISAYEEGMFAEIAKQDPSEELVLTGYMHPLTSLQSTLEVSLLSADSGMEEVVNSIILGENRSAIKSSEEEKALEEEEIKHFYNECSITDVNGDPTEEWWDPQAGVTKKNLNFSGKEPVGYEYKKRFTNEYKRNFGGKVSKWIEDNAPTVDFNNKTYNLNIEECLNCMFEYNVELTMPSLEFVFNLDKFLKSIQSLLDQMKKAMDPSLLYDAICKFILNFDANFMCPANLVGINLVLPTLFLKYSLDLAKIRFDWTGLFGVMIKGVLDFLVQAVEAIPKIVNPFIDCIINAFKTVMNALKAIMSSAEKITNETISAVNQVGYALQKTIPFGWDKVSEDLEQEYTSLKESLDERIAEQDQRMIDYENDELKEEIEKFAEFLKSISYKETGDPINNPLNKEAAAKALEVYLKEENKKELRDYFEYVLPKKSEEESKLNSTYQKKIQAAKRKEKLEEEKDFFNLDFVADTKTITTPWFSKQDKPDKRLNFDYAGYADGNFYFTGRDASKEKSEWSALDYAFAKYGIDIKNEYKQPKDLIDYRAKGWAASLDRTDTFKFINQTIIGSLLEGKKWMNEQVAKITQTLKAIQAFMGEVVESEFKVLGDIQAILHLIRFIKLIMKFFEEGLSCKNVKENKKTMEEIISKNNQNVAIESSSQSLEYDNRVLNPEEYIKIRHKLTDKISIIDLNECSNLSSMIQVNKDNLDSIYEGILNGTSI